MDLGLEGKTAVIAASSAGLGYGAAAALSRNGARVVVNGREGERLARAAESIPGSVPVPGDVSTEGGASAFMTDAAAALGGPPDILVLNGGGPPPGTFASTPSEAYAPALENNLLAPIAMCQSATAPMIENGWGRIVAITSVAVRQPIGTLILSNTARTGLTGFLKTLALEVALHGVTVNSVLPGYHATDRLVSAIGDDMDALAAEVPSGTIGDPAQFGDVVAFLCSEQANYVTGSALCVDGGMYRGTL